MTRKSGKSRAELSAWQIENLRLTLFFVPRWGGSSAGWWNGLTGNEPESSVVKPKTGERVEIGPWQDLQLTLHFQPRVLRIDWVLTAGDRFDETNCPFTDAIGPFRQIMDSWLNRSDLPQATRLAFGAIVQLPVKSHEEGYLTISNYLDFDLDRSTSSDFQYQINRSRSSTTIADVRINRLTKWSAGKYTRHTLALMEGGLVAIGDPETLKCSCRIELDINTHPEAEKELPRDRLAPLLDEMATLVQEIIREGDIP